MKNGGGPPAVKRTYDAQSRRERAEHERRATEERVVAAARRRFLADGYSATRMVDIAAEAGVAIASVYRAGRSKAELIQMVVERDIAGDDPANRRPSLGSPERPVFPEIEAAAPDPERQVELMADRIADVMSRLAPLWAVLRDAASVDERAAAMVEATHQHRATSFEVAVGLLPEHRLRISAQECVDTLWALSSPEIFLALSSARGWTLRHYGDWLRRTLLVQLLVPESGAAERSVDHGGSSPSEPAPG